MLAKDLGIKFKTAYYWVQELNTVYSMFVSFSSFLYTLHDEKQFVQGLSIYNTTLKNVIKIDDTKILKIDGSLASSMPPILDNCFVPDGD